MALDLVKDDAIRVLLHNPPAPQVVQNSSASSGCCLLL